MIIKSLMSIPKYQVGETYKKGKRLFHIVRVESLHDKIFVLEIVNGYIDSTKDFTFTEQEMSVFKKVESDKGRVIGSLTKVEKGGYDLHLIEIQEGENYDQMYFTEQQFLFIQNLISHVDKFHIAKNILTKDKK